MPWMYILECRGGAFYVGSTGRELETRVWEHNADDDLAATFTRRRRPVRLVYAEWFDRVDLAFEREKQVQGWRRAKKVALISQRGVDLPRLSQGGCRPSEGPDLTAHPETSTSSASSAPKTTLSPHPRPRARTQVP